MSDYQEKRFQAALVVLHAVLALTSKGWTSEVPLTEEAVAIADALLKELGIEDPAE